jgi:membrane-associated HD superfamily phosphohydrolase
MLNQAVDPVGPLSRRDVSRLGVATVVLVVILTAILGVDVFPQPLKIEVGSVATADILAPRPADYVSQVETSKLQTAARDGVDPQYDFTTQGGVEIAKEQLRLFDQRVQPIDQAFADGTSQEERNRLLAAALEGIPAQVRITLLGLTPEQWAAVRAEASRVLDATESAELREPVVEDTRARLTYQMAGGLTDDQRTLAATIIDPLIVANSFFSADLTAAAKDRAAAAVQPQRVQISANEAIVRRGDKVTPEQFEAINEYHLRDAKPTSSGWAAGCSSRSSSSPSARLDLAVPARALAPDERDALIALIVVGTAILLKATAGRPGLSFVVPTAAAGMLIAVLLDAGVATMVMIVIAVLGGAMADPGNQLEYATYILVGGMAGIIAIRRGDRLQVFVQAGLAVAVANVLVVSTFALLGLHDARGLLELVGASVASAAGSAIAAVGTFAVLGSLFGIMTVFQLLELANPSQPLLRRLLVETPGTYHHSLMVGNLAERAAEAIGADPLLTRVAAYYHDIGKLATRWRSSRTRPAARTSTTSSTRRSRPRSSSSTSPTDRHRLREQAAEGPDRVHPAAPRDGDHELLLRPGPGGRRRRRSAVSRPKAGRRPRRGSTSASSATSGPSPVARGGPDHARRRRRGVRPLAGVPRRGRDPGDGRADHRRAPGRRPVRRVRPDPARPRADPRGVHRAAPGDVPPARRLPPEQGRRDRVAPRGRDRHRGVRQRTVYVQPWRIDVTVRDGVDPVARIAGLCRASPGRSTRPAPRRRPRSG